jgi:hypothetical protein
MSSKNIAAINRIYEAFESRDFLAGLQPFVFPLEDHVAIEHLIDGGDRVAVASRGHGTIRDTAAASTCQLCTSGNSKTD